MKKYVTLYTIFIAISLSMSIPCLAQALKVTKLGGGSVITELGYGITINKGSSLNRTMILFNDPSCPLQLINSSVNTMYVKRGYEYNPAGSIKTVESISAFEIRFLLYDVFGGHITTLSGTEIADIDADKTFDLSNIGTWRAWESDVSGLLTVVSFVARVRTESGKIWRYNVKAVEEKLSEVRLEASEGLLSPKKDK